jgi:hypothetical protein
MSLARIAIRLAADSMKTLNRWWLICIDIALLVAMGVYLHRSVYFRWAATPPGPKQTEFHELSVLYFGLSFLSGGGAGLVLVRLLRR